jgi:hypothetical protein
MGVSSVRHTEQLGMLTLHVGGCGSGSGSGSGVGRVVVAQWGESLIDRRG